MAKGEDVWGVVLAAGLSERMGTSKLLLPIGGEAIIRRVVRAASGSRLRQVIVVTGHDAEAIEGHVTDFPVMVVRNIRYREGQSTSMKAGLDAVPPGASAVIFIPGDQPFITSQLIDALIDERARSSALVVAPSYKGQRGAPVLFDSSLRPELMDIQGDVGGREVVERHKGEVATVAVDDETVLDDVDDWEDYRLAEAR